MFNVGMLAAITVVAMTAMAVAAYRNVSTAAVPRILRDDRHTGLRKAAALHVTAMRVLAVVTSVFQVQVGIAVAYGNLSLWHLTDTAVAALTPYDVVGTLAVMAYSWLSWFIGGFSDDNRRLPRMYAHRVFQPWLIKHRLEDEGRRLLRCGYGLVDSASDPIP